MTGRLARANTLFLLCDVQTRFQTVIDGFPSLLNSCSLMLKASTVLNIPVIVTEQYPKGLGHTVPELNLNQPNVLGVFEKSLFSMYIPEVAALIASQNRRSIVIFGLETHVCVQQTVLDLRDNGFDVHVIADGVSSQRPLDRQVALDRMRSAGAFVSTSESVLMELLRDKNSTEFKEISNLLKAAAKY
eukprot:c7901_g1_i1.p1 GENE.c7901_g1_i1~~c7901_g1_i1.p1  ORF type:complete len:188 (-),score=21.48 c7901_g1_i1:65-628(-)